MDLSSVFAVCPVKEGSKRPLFGVERVGGLFGGY